ncbi:MAG: isochorismatase family protein [Actinobacteria bacterium]|nr:MAG: isochorismatase family protein [Actinomycetota bacterium]
MPIYDERTALLIVDVQNDFADPHGSLYVAGGHEVPAVANAELRQALEGRAFVAYTQDWHPEHTPHFAIDGGIWPVHCVHDTWGAAFHPDLRVEGEVVRKGSDGRDGYSGFSVRDPESGETYPTLLEHLLRDARMLGFAVEVLADGIRAVDLHEGDGERALRRMRDAGAEIV